MRVIMMGTGPFAVPSFRALLASGHEVPLLVTQPERDSPGRKGAAPAPMRAAAVERGVPIFDPVSVNTPEAQAELARFAADLLVVADYGQILKRDTLAAARLGGINLHAALLPRYRGAAPIAWALYHGETVTGLSVIQMTPRLDGGPVLAQTAVEIDPDETAGLLEARLAEMGAGLVLETLARLAAGTVEPLPQDPALASLAPRLKKTDGRLDWSRSATELRNQIRAFDPWPKNDTWWLRPGHEPCRLILGKTTVEPRAAGDAPPGTVLAAERDRFVVACGSGALRIHTVQPAGKRLLNADEFLRGYPVRPGDRLGEPGERE